MKYIQHSLTFVVVAHLIRKKYHFHWLVTFAKCVRSKDSQSKSPTCSPLFFFSLFVFSFSCLPCCYLLLYLCVVGVVGVLLGCDAECGRTGSQWRREEKSQKEKKDRKRRKRQEEQQTRRKGDKQQQQQQGAHLQPSPTGNTPRPIRSLLPPPSAAPLLWLVDAVSSSSIGCPPLHPSPNPTTHLTIAIPIERESDRGK